MCSMSCVELLYKRGRVFYDYALIAFERGDYDITVFMCEQAAQLSLKGYSPQNPGIHSEGAWNQRATWIII